MQRHRHLNSMACLKNCRCKAIPMAKMRKTFSSSPLLKFSLRCIRHSSGSWGFGLVLSGLVSHFRVKGISTNQDQMSS